jgi:hypothetical protein
MKEMKYQPFPTFAILASGSYQGFQYWAVSLETHPTAYVDITPVKDELEENPPLPCHGGVTYDEDNLQNVWDSAFEGFVPGERRFIGWDYAHSGDYMSMSNFMQDGRKYTTEMIVADIKEAIDDMLKEESEK